MTSRGYINDFYRQFEELNQKMDKLLKENKEQSLTIYYLNSTIDELKKIIEEKDKKIELLLNENDKLKNNKNKNSTNSSKPSSTNISTPKKKTGPNLYKFRIPSDRKPGAVLGHQEHSLTKENVENLIKEKKVRSKDHNT